MGSQTREGLGKTSYFQAKCVNSGKELQFVVEFKYLGHILLHNMSDNVDIEREIRKMFFRANILVRKFSQCSSAVKVQLF